MLHQVFRPLATGNQYYLVLFLAGALPLTLLSYRARRRRGAAAGADDQPRAADWVLAVVALAGRVYPVLPVSFGAAGGGGFNAFLDRQGRLTTLDMVAGGLLLVLCSRRPAARPGGCCPP